MTGRICDSSKRGLRTHQTKEYQRTKNANNFERLLPAFSQPSEALFHTSFVSSFGIRLLDPPGHSLGTNVDGSKSNKSLDFREEMMLLM